MYEHYKPNLIALDQLFKIDYIFTIYITFELIGRPDKRKMFDQYMEKSLLQDGRPCFKCTLCGKQNLQKINVRNHNISRTVAEVYLTDPGAMLTRREDKYTSASPRCTCLPPRQHCAEVALGAFTTDSSAMLTRREASTPRLRLGVLASLLVNIALKLHSEESKYTSATPRCTCFPPRATSTQVPLVQVQVPKSNSASPRWTWGLGLGLGGLERSRPSPPPPAVGLIP